MGHPSLLDIIQQKPLKVNHEVLLHWQQRSHLCWLRRWLLGFATEHLYFNQLDGWKEALQSRTQELQTETQNLKESYEVWKLTSELANANMRMNTVRQIAARKAPAKAIARKSERPKR